MLRLAIKNFLLLLFVIISFNTCSQGYDKDLIRFDSNGGEYFTPLGCLVHAPWEFSNFPDGFNTKFFLNGKEILSTGTRYNQIQKDLVFELHKDGSLTYWLKSENYIVDSPKKEISRIIRQSTENDNLKKKYDKSFWKVNYNDSTLLINFARQAIPNIRFKYIELGSAYANFEQTYFIDSLINGKKITLKKVNTFYFEHPFIRF